MKIEKTTDPALYIRVLAFVNSIEFSKSNNTILSYLYDIIIGFNFFAEEDKTLWSKIKSININDFRSLCAFRRENNISISSQQRMIATWKNFFRFQKLDNLDSFRMPKLPKRLPRPIMKSSIDDLLLESSKNWLEMRNKALWVLMYSSGMRISEALSIKREQIHNKNDLKSLIIKGKGDKDRLIPLLPIALRYINEYLEARPSNCEYVFIGKEGDKLSQQTAAHIFKTWKTKYNLSPRITLHSLRHGFATHLLENKLPLTGIQKLLGHCNLKTTSQYIYVCDKSLEASFMQSMKKKYGAE